MEYKTMKDFIMYAIAGFISALIYQILTGTFK